jgi:CheY-like chemotaxis protein
VSTSPAWGVGRVGRHDPHRRLVDAEPVEAHHSLPPIHRDVTQSPRQSSGQKNHPTPHGTGGWFFSQSIEHLDGHHGMLFMVSDVKSSMLLVDDEPDMLDFLTRALGNDFDVTTTESPWDALARLSRRQFDALISDNRMPEMSGLDLLEKASLAQPRMKRVLLTGYSDSEAIAAAIDRAIVQAHLEKPIDSHSIINALQIVLSP